MPTAPTAARDQLLRHEFVRIPTAVTDAVTLLDRLEVRRCLDPIVVAKYLNSRDTPARRRAFRQHRGAIQRSSRHAQRAMTDPKGVLNPGLMPRISTISARLPLPGLKSMTCWLSDGTAYGSLADNLEFGNPFCCHERWSLSRSRQPSSLA